MLTKVRSRLFSQAFGGGKGRAWDVGYGERQMSSPFSHLAPFPYHSTAGIPLVRDYCQHHPVVEHTAE